MRFKFSSSTNSNLNQHVKMVHEKIKDFKCTLCEFSSSTKGDLNRHIKMVHDKIKDFKCNLCEYKCSTNGILKTHVKMVHYKIKDFKCTKCDYSCSTKSNLKIHVKQVHDKIKDFKCTLCDYSCTTNGNLNIHIKTCTGKNTRFSSGEFQVVKALEELGFIENKDYVFDSSFSELTDYCGRNLRFDFRFLNHNIIIEYDGRQHFEPVCFGSISKEKADEKFKILQECDKAKDDFCKEFGYKMIRIKYTDFSNILGILSNELFEIVDWINNGIFFNK